MKKVFVFCIGGTGIRVMKSIVMLMAGGMDACGYTIVPIILDPHLDLEEKKNLQTLLQNYIKVYKNSVNNGEETVNSLNGFFGSEIQLLSEIDGDLNDEPIVGVTDKFGSYINKDVLSANDSNNFLIETMFSTKNLNNSLSVGFKGNPNVGTVALTQKIDGADWFKSFKSHCQEGDRVFIISSIFGGTGASGYPLLEKMIKNTTDQPTVKNALMGAVTVLPYYGLKDPAASGSDIDSANFYTKTKSALAYYENTVLSDYLYYIGEKSLKQDYVNDESKQDDKAHFIELIAASALFDFLQRPKPDTRQYMKRSINDDVESMDLVSLGDGYKDIVKSVADTLLLQRLIEVIKKEKYFPLKQSKGFDANFYQEEAFGSLEKFTSLYYNWYKELAQNKRAFAPIHFDDLKNMSGWIKGHSLDAKDDSFYLLEMIKAGNRSKDKDCKNKFRLFLQFAFEAINCFTSKIK